MKIQSVRANNRSRSFEIDTRRGTFSIPYAKLEARPCALDPIVDLYVDPELAREGFTYVLRSGVEDSVLADQVFDYNEEPGYMRELLVYNLSAEAKQRLEASELSTREVIRRLGTSPSQFYRLIDTANTRKSVDSLLALLQVLGYEVEFTIRPKTVSGPSLKSKTRRRQAAGV